MKLYKRRVLFCLTAMFSVIILCGCGGSSTTHQYLMIPNAVFVSGTPSSGGSAAPTTQKPVITAPSSTTYTVNQIVTWTVDFSVVTEVTVKDIIIEVDDINGYFVYPLTDAEIAAGTVDIETEVVNTEPAKTQYCNRDYRGNGTCYEQADTGVTGMDFSAASDDGTNISWTPIVAETISIPAVENNEPDNSDSGDTVCSAWTSYCSCNIRACVDDTRSWYDVGSGVYYCASQSNCTTAASNAVAYCTQGC
jgi:hypothetical protein